jgi:hypothetical protein
LPSLSPFLQLLYDLKSADTAGIASVNAAFQQRLEECDSVLYPGSSYGSAAITTTPTVYGCVGVLAGSCPCLAACLSKDVSWGGVGSLLMRQPLGWGGVGWGGWRGVGWQQLADDCKPHSSLCLQWAGVHSLLQQQTRFASHMPTEEAGAAAAVSSGIMPLRAGWQ